MENEAILDRLFTSKQINLNRGELFDQAMKPIDEGFDPEKVEGMLLGVAIGDALGATSESYVPRERRHVFGEIRDYLMTRGGERIGLPTDDTQLTFWTLEQLIRDRGFKPGNLADQFVGRGTITGIGKTVAESLQRYRSGKRWYESGLESAGNGALMRISPMLIPHLRKGGTDVWVDTALSAIITHNDRASTSACLALIGMLRDLLEMKEPPDPEWWSARYVELARDLEGRPLYRPGGTLFPDYRGTVWKYAERCVQWAESQFISTVDACNNWSSSAYLMGTIPSLLLILTRYGHDPEEALVRAVNDTWDNDTIASLTGAMIGALHGRSGFPARWIERLSGRTGESDDGYIFRLIAEAKETFLT
ncbi:MAG: ADP-ribosylglycohydrolase family protein [Blastocatellia bacterium]